jgi:hypothetical protein
MYRFSFGGAKLSSTCTFKVAYWHLSGGGVQEQLAVQTRPRTRRTSRRLANRCSPAMKNRPSLQRSAYRCDARLQAQCGGQVPLHAQARRTGAVTSGGLTCRWWRSTYVQGQLGTRCTGGHGAPSTSARC